MDTLPFHTPNDKPSIPAMSGVYKITCATNGKIYIGSALNLRRRKASHFRQLHKNKHENLYLQRAFNKYGEDAFTFEVLELVLIPEMLTAREQYWFDKLRPFDKRGFNILSKAGSALGYKHTPETIAKISKANTGKERTPETLEKLRQSHLGKPCAFKGQTHTPEARKKIRQARSQQQIPRTTIEAMRKANLEREHVSQPNTYRIEGDAAYITLAGGLETIIDISDLEHVLKIHWHAQYHERSDSYQARGMLPDRSIYLNRYLTGAKERERVNHLNNNTLDNRRSNLRIAQITDTYHNRRSVPSKLGIRGVSVDKQKVTGSLAYQFRCRGCKISKNFPYTEEGLDAARVFSEAHYAAMETNQQEA